MEHRNGTLENSTVDQKNSKNSQPTVTRFLTHQPQKGKKKHLFLTLNQRLESILSYSHYNWQPAWMPCQPRCKSSPPGRHRQIRSDAPNVRCPKKWGFCHMPRHRMRNSAALGGKKKLKKWQAPFGRFCWPQRKKQLRKGVRIFNLEVLQVILNFFVFRFKKPILPNKNMSKLER